MTVGLQIAGLVGAGAALIILVVLGVMILAGLAIFLFVFWILMIVDCATRKFKNDTDRVVWILILIFLGLIGAIIYYFVVKRNG